MLRPSCFYMSSKVHTNFEADTFNDIGSIAVKMNVAVNWQYCYFMLSNLVAVFLLSQGIFISNLVHVG